jgi:hypothetical protein
MKTISLHVSEQTYDELKSVAARQNRPVAALIREAMDAYIASEQRSGSSVLDLEPFHCGPLREEWTRSELLDEMLER